MGNNRRRGHIFEREVAIAFREIFPAVRRKLEYHIQDCVGVDLVDVGPYKVQCKRSKRPVPIHKIKEIKEVGIHLLVSKVDREEIMLTMYFDDFLEMLREQTK